MYSLYSVCFLFLFSFVFSQRLFWVVERTVERTGGRPAPGAVGACRSRQEVGRRSSVRGGERGRRGGEVGEVGHGVDRWEKHRFT